MKQINHHFGLAENALRIPWVTQEIQKQIGPQANVLEIGCGKGLFSNSLTQHGFTVTGVDLSKEQLEEAKYSDPTNKTAYVEATPYSLPFKDGSFDVVCALDVLEHVEEPGLVIAEASRVLKPNGVFFFHTFSRNLFSYLLVIKGVDWFVKDKSEKTHTYSLFIRPHELDEHLSTYKLKVTSWKGVKPKLFSRALIKLLTSRKIPEDFSFEFSKCLLTGYCGMASKQQIYLK